MKFPSRNNFYCFFIFLFILFTGSTYKALSQPYLDVASVTYTYQQPFRNIEQPRFNTINQTIAYINVPLKIRKDYLLLTPTVEFLDVRFENSLNSYRSAQFTVSWLHQWKNEKWNTAFVAIAGSNGMKQNWFEDNTLQAGGAILSTFTKNENLKYKFGLYGNAEFFGPYILPLLGIDWNINQRLNLFGILPSYMTLEYKIVPGKFHGKISLDAETVSYRTPGRQFLRVNDNHLKMIYDFYLTKNIVLSAEAGHSVLRDFKFGLRQNSKTNYFNTEKLPDAFLLRAGLYFRVATNGK